MSDNTVAFINVVDVEPDKCDDLVTVLKEGAEQVIINRQGFVSLELLVSKDKTRVVNVAKWASAEDAKATQQDPQAAEFAKRAAELASPSPGIYDVVARH